MTVPQTIETVDDLISICDRYYPGQLPQQASSFIDFGLQTHKFALGDFKFETETLPSVLFRECQSLVVGSADSATDAAKFFWIYAGGSPFEAAPDKMRDLVISLVLEEFSLAGDTGVNVDFDDSAPFLAEGELQILWRGQSISYTHELAVCGIAFGRLWVMNPGRFDPFSGSSHFCGVGGDECPVAAADCEEDPGPVMGEVREPCSDPFDFLDDGVQPFGGAVRSTGRMPRKDRFSPLFQGPGKTADLFDFRDSTIFDDRIDPHCSQGRFTPQRVEITSVLFR
jgi:hypothetical protein